MLPAIKKKLVSRAKRWRYRHYGRHNARDWQQAAKTLAYIAQRYSQQDLGKPALVIGTASDLVRELGVQLRRRQVGWEHQERVSDAAAYDHYSCILIAEKKAKRQTAIAASLLNIPAAENLPTEYIAIPTDEHRPLSTFDAYADWDFVSPLQVAYGSLPQELYLESLQRFELKTDVRDYLDLWQVLASLVEPNGIPGNIAEFGSYRGHSGYLISRILEALGSDKQLFMFDTFEQFPVEESGVDRYWSNTHQVDFTAIQAKFENRSNVTLVQGDFSQTLASTNTGELSLAYIDCDSLRGTKYLLESLWEQRLSVGGMVIVEDYGHAALLGSRLAVQQFFRERTDAFCFFSQFSGFYIALKKA